MLSVQPQANAIPTPADIRALMGERGFDACDSAQAIAQFHTLAQSLIPVEIASVDTLSGVQEKTGASLYLRWEDGAPSAFLAFFAFTKAGEFALRTSTFSGAKVKPEWVSAAGPKTKLGYVWCFGGVSKRACVAVVRAGKTVREQCFPHLGVLARAATEAGERLMAPMGFAPVQPSDGLYYSKPFSRSTLSPAS